MYVTAEPLYASSDLPCAKPQPFKSFTDLKNKLIRLFMLSFISKLLKALLKSVTFIANNYLVSNLVIIKSNEKLYHTIGSGAFISKLFGK